MAIQPGTDIGRYHILDQLGEGGMAVVYKAYDTQLEREVAVKVLRFNQTSSAVSLKRFNLDAKILAKLKHTNIIKVLDYGEHEGVPYLVMDYIHGGTLKQMTGRPIEWRKALKILIPIARALDYAHRQEVIHRDVKPSNILIDDDGQPLLTDFGIAKMLETTETLDLTRSGFGIGTPEYMPPEVFDDQPLDRRADVYSLGIVLYELVTGRTPFKADTPLAILKKHAMDPLPKPSLYNPFLPKEIEQILYKALAKKPGDRYQSMAKFADALEALLADENIQAGYKPDHSKTFLPASIIGIAFLTIVLIIVLRPGRSKTTDEKLIDAEEVVEVSPEYQGVTVDNQEEPEALAIPTLEFTPAVEPTDTPEAVRSLGIGSTMTSEMDGMKMVYVPAGEFEMGAAAGDSMAYADEKPQHTVYLDAFWMDVTEVTNGMYEQCVRAGVCQSQKKYYHNPSTGTDHFGEPAYEDYPAVYVNWEDANTYCLWVGRRLPTEAEWEKAAKGETDYRYPWGNSDPNLDLANCDGMVGDTVEVGSYPDGASVYGVLDMTGNVYEWVSDWYGENYYSVSGYSNPQGPAKGSTHVIRGGSFFAESKYSRTTYRESPANSDSEGYGSGNWGFRCVLEAE